MMLLVGGSWRRPGMRTRAEALACDRVRVWGGVRLGQSINIEVQGGAFHEEGGSDARHFFPYRLCCWSATQRARDRSTRRLAATALWGRRRFSRRPRWTLGRARAPGTSRAGVDIPEGRAAVAWSGLNDRRFRLAAIRILGES